MTQKRFLHLARALIANPEILCIHKPTLPFDSPGVKKVIMMLGRFVREKGVWQDDSERWFRRPRTCFFTASRREGIDLADQVLAVNKKRGVYPMDKGDVTDALLR